jgi:arylsulfatase A
MFWGEVMTALVSRFACVAAMLLVTFGMTQHGHAQQPNIVFVLVDDLGWGDLSCYGQSHWKTGRLDRMAAEGMRFTRAYAGSTVCAPSRATLLTGNHTGRLYMRGNGSIELRPDPLDMTIATRLQALGYATAMIGKSGVACNSDNVDLPHQKGFDHFYGLLSHTAAHRHYPRQLVENGHAVTIEGNAGKTGTQYASELFVDNAIEWMQGRQDGRPFFLHLALTPPHADLAAPDRFVAPFRGRWEETPHTTGGYLHQPEPRAAYAGMVAFLDESMGRVLDSLVELGIEENTVVFFASDNGPHFEGGADADVFDSNGPWRGGKRDLTEGGVRTPMIVWWPGTVAPGSTSDHATAFWDFPATALDLAGAPIPELMDGISIVPTLRGRAADQSSHSYLYWEFHERGGKQAVVLDDFKGIRLGVGADRAAPIILYDLAADPGETVNVASEHPQVVRRIEQAMDDAHMPSARFRFGAR